MFTRSSTAAGRLRRGFAFVLAAATLTQPAAAAAMDAGLTVAVVGATFQVTTADGRRLDQAELVGMTLTVGAGSGARSLLRIDSVEPDPDNQAGDVMLYALSTPDPVTGAWRNVCMPGPDGRRLGFPLPGRWTADGDHRDEPGAFSIACTAGAQAKCVRFGYRPWAKAADGTALRDHHLACTRMLRADYCGTGEPHTRNGTPVMVYDALGIQTEEPAPEMTFEAAWGPDGAVCVSRVRHTDLASTAAIADACPWVATLRAADACADHPGALVLNRSTPRSGPARAR